MGKMKKAIALVLVAALILSFAACGNRSNDSGTNNEGSGLGTASMQGYAFVADFIDIDIPGVSDVQMLGIVGDTIYFRFHPEHEWSETLPTSMEEALGPGPGIASMQTDGSGFTILWQGEQGQWETPDGGFGWYSESIASMVLRSDGSMIGIRMKSMNESNNFDFHMEEEYFLVELAPDGTVVREVDMVAELNFSQNDMWNVMGLEALSDGRILFAMHDALVILNPDFTFARRHNWEEVVSFAVTRNDDVLVSTWGDDWRNADVFLFDLETGDILREDESLLTIQLHGATRGHVFDLYVMSDRAVFGFDMEAGETTELFTWMGLDMINAGVPAPTASGDMFLFEQNWTPGGVTTNLVHLRRVDAASIPQRITLVYGAMEVSWEMRREIIEFNRRNQTHRIDIREYFDWMAGDDMQDAIRRLNTDIITGNAPDILEISSFPFEAYARRGFLADLGAKIDADPTLNRTDFVENVMELLEVENTLYTITSGFSIRTVTGATERVGPDMGWTMEQFRAAVAEVEAAGGTAFGEHLSREDFLHSVLMSNMGQFIDRETGTANFDSDLFRSYIAFAATLPTSEELWGGDWGDGPGGWARPVPLPTAAASPISYVSAETADVEVEPNYIEIEPPIGGFPIDEWESPHATGQVLLMETGLWGFGEIHWLQEDTFRGDITFIGYPSEEGTGSIVSPRTLLAISAQSQHQDVAWEFIRTILTEDFQKDNNFSFPMRVDLLNQIAQLSLRNPETFADSERWANVWQQLTQQQVDQVMELINRADQLESRDVTVFDMIQEELLPFFAGDRSVEETTRIIQNRVQLYVSERG